MTHSFEPPEPPVGPPGNPPGEHEPMIEGEEPPPKGVKVMAVVRWCLLAVAAFVAVSAWWSYAGAELRGDGGTEPTHAKYHCPMHPQIVSNDPGECPICHMSLEPIPANRAAPASPMASSPSTGAKGKTSPPGDTDMKGGSGGTPGDKQPAGSASAGAASNTKPGEVPPGTTPVTLTLDRVQAIGVRTAVAEEGSMTQTLRVTAVVAPTEQGAAEVHVRSPGFVEKILVNQTGVAVARDQALFAIYSPELLQAQSELLTTHQWASAGTAVTTADAARRKLELLGMAPKDIDKVLKTRETMRAVPVYATSGGFVTKKNLVAGSYVTPDMALYEIQDLSHVFIVADVFQRDMGYLQKGTAGRFVPTRHPDQAIEVHVDLIYPTVNAEARTTRVRMQVKNPKGVTFRPGEYGSVEFSTPERRAVIVPRDAVIDTGLHTYIFVVQGEGIYSPREVVLGEEHEEMVTVLAGVGSGDRVVSGATFLIDSESRLQASAARVATTAPSGPKKGSPDEGPSCDEIDRNKYPDKWTECQKCVQVHRGMGSMEADCKNAIPKPWK